jgi:hypothetical protein
MSHYIKEQAATAVLDQVQAALAGAINSFAAYQVSLADSEKRGIRTMSTGREGYARAISHIASVHVRSLARSLDPATLLSMLHYDMRLEGLRQQLMAFSEIITETQIANGVDTMMLVDAFAANLQTARKLDAALDNAMGEIDEWNKRFSPGKKDMDKPATEG